MKFELTSEEAAVIYQALDFVRRNVPIGEVRQVIDLHDKMKSQQSEQATNAN